MRPAKLKRIPSSTPKHRRFDHWKLKGLPSFAKASENKSKGSRRLAGDGLYKGVDEDSGK